MKTPFISEYQARALGFEFIVKENEIEIVNYVGNRKVIILPSKIDNKICSSIKDGALDNYATHILVPETYRSIGSFNSSILKEIVFLGTDFNLSKNQTVDILIDSNVVVKVKELSISSKRLRKISNEVNIINEIDLEKYKALNIELDRSRDVYYQENSEQAYFKVEQDNLGLYGLTKVQYDVSPLTIPKIINGKIISYLGEKSFSFLGLKSLSIPFGITSIAYRALHCNSISSLVLPLSLIYVNPSAFKIQVEANLELILPKSNKDYYPPLSENCKTYSSGDLGSYLTELFSTAGKQLLQLNQYIYLGSSNGIELYTMFNSLKEDALSELKQYCYIREEGTFRELSKDSYLPSKFVVSNLVGYLVATEFIKGLELNNTACGDENSKTAFSKSNLF